MREKQEKRKVFKSEAELLKRITEFNFKNSFSTFYEMIQDFEKGRIKMGEGGEKITILQSYEKDQEFKRSQDS